MLKNLSKFKKNMAKSHKSCMEQAEIIDTFGTYHVVRHNRRRRRSHPQPGALIPIVGATLATQRRQHRRHYAMENGGRDRVCQCMNVRLLFSFSHSTPLGSGYRRPPHGFYTQPSMGHDLYATTATSP